MTHQQDCQAFFDSRNSLILSTLDKDNITETSVTPFVKLNGALYIYVSELAKHTKNLLWMLQNEFTQLSGLLVADESSTEQLFARERMTLQLHVEEIKREQDTYNQAIALFSEQFGEVVAMLSSLPDFHLMKLTPINGGYVRGFGQAFAFENGVCHGLKPISRN